MPEISLESVVDRKDNDIAKRLLSIDYNAEIIWLRYVKLTIFSPGNYLALVDYIDRFFFPYF